MSSRKSSRNSQSLKGIDFQAAVNAGMANENKKSLASRISSFLFTLVLNGSILYYLYNLEDADCNCIRDWRHNFIKAMCLVVIFLSFVGLIGFNLKSTRFMFLALIYLILIVINIYALFTYVGDLNDTQCACAVKKQPNLNSIMNALRWLYVIIIGLSLLVIITFVGIGYSHSKSISSK